MAINDQADIRCSDPWHVRPENPEAPAAAGFIEFKRGASWWPRCQPCIDRHGQNHPYTLDVGYLDPARQRRPNPNHHDEDPRVHHLVDGSCYHDDCP